MQQYVPRLADGKERHAAVLYFADEEGVGREVADRVCELLGQDENGQPGLVVQSCHINDEAIANFVSSSSVLVCLITKQFCHNLNASNLAKAYIDAYNIAAVSYAHQLVVAVPLEQDLLDSIGPERGGLVELLLDKCLRRENGQFAMKTSDASLDSVWSAEAGMLAKQIKCLANNSFFELE